MRDVDRRECQCARNAWPQGELNHPRKAPTAFATASYQLPNSRLSGSESAEGSLISNRTAPL